MTTEDMMFFNARRILGAALVISLFVQMHIATDGYAAGGTQIAFASTRDGNSEIYVMDGDGKNRRRETVDPAADFLPAWSPDGKKIAFVSNRTNRNKRINQIWVTDADGKNPIRLTNGLGDSNPDWSPDGTQILYDAHLELEEHNPGHDGITVMDADGKNKRLLTPEGAHPSWSPDGKRIVYTHGQIYVMDADGRNSEQLTHDVGFKRMPSWSPDGRRIAYVVQGIWVMDSDGENQVQLTKINGDNHPTWSPESDAIAFQSRRDGGPRIYTVDVSSGDVNVMQHAPKFGDGQPDWHSPGAFSVSPEGSRITMWGRLKKFASSLR